VVAMWESRKSVKRIAETVQMKAMACQQAIKEARRLRFIGEFQ
jgi:hypothetical protein